MTCPYLSLTSHPQGSDHVLCAGQGTDQRHRVDEDLLDQHREISQGDHQPQGPQEDGGDVAAGAGNHRSGTLGRADQSSPLLRGELGGVRQVDAAADDCQGVHGDAGLDVPQQVEALRG